MEVKYASRPFGKLNEAELTVAANGLLLKIHAMTGWAVPELTFAQILKDQFQKKMKEAYSTVNADEVEYAFRTYGTQVKDWGKQMNLSLIDEVMTPYLEARLALSRLEESKTKELPESKEDLSDKAMQDWYESTAAQLRAEQITYDHLPVMIYDWLDKKGEIRLDNKKKFAYMDEAAKRIESEGGAAEMEKVKTLAKKLVLNDYILKNA